jgi:predicted glutamine amidotransferase
MYAHKNKVYIEKGFMNFEDFYNRLMEIDRKIHLKNKSLVLHFRIGTSGKNDGATCHPFPITNNFDLLRAEKTTAKIAMVHNGIISNYAYDKILSDTQNYVKDFVFCLYELNNNFLNNKYILPVLEQSCNNTKLAFLTSDDKIYYVGDFIEDNGIYYSNATYKYSYKKYYNTTTKYYGNYADYWDYYDDYYENTYDKEETDENDMIYYEEEENLKRLSDKYFYCTAQSEDGSFTVADNSLCIDENYNLYEILDDKGILWKIQIIGTDTFLYDTDYVVTSFKDIKSESECDCNGDTGNAKKLVNM